MADLVHMQQEIDGETRSMTCHPGAVAQWEEAGWAVVQPADNPPSEVPPADNPPAPRARGEKQGS